RYTVVCATSFNSHHTHPALHSFPTRRSSDLDAVARGVGRERRRAERLSAMIQSKSDRIRDLNQTVLELKEQLRRGTTPQLEGLRSEEHTSELQSRFDLVCRLLLEKKKKKR